MSRNSGTIVLNLVTKPLPGLFAGESITSQINLSCNLFEVVPGRD
ncbi:hypothetical protein AB0758_46565 [Tolypothrix bouteillei VB521301_2]